MPTVKGIFKPQLATAFNLSLPPYSLYPLKHPPMVPLPNYRHLQLYFLVQNRCLNRNHQPNGNALPPQKVFSTRKETGKSGTRRNRSGLIGGVGMGKIKRKRRSGLPRYLPMLVSVFLSPIILPCYTYYRIRHRS